MWLEGSDLELRGYKLRTTTTPRFLSICWAGGRDFHWLVRSDEENEIIRIYIYIIHMHYMPVKTNQYVMDMSGFF